MKGEITMTIFNEYEPIFRRQAWEDYQDYKAELEDDIMLEQMNKMYNRKGLLLADYLNGYNEDY